MEYRVILDFRVRGDISPEEAIRVAKQFAGGFALVPQQDIKVYRYHGEQESENPYAEVRSTGVQVLTTEPLA